MTEEEQEFCAWFEGLGVQHFTADELLYMGVSHSSEGVSGYGLNQIPPKEFWGNVETAIRELDALRAYFGAAVRLLSLYRSPDYNEAIGGASNSEHMKFTAIDFP